jgi:O-antigen/teichoic acid export membrane protein
MLKNSLYNASGGVIRIAVSILTIPLLVHLLGTEEYGLFVLASTVVSIVTLAESGLSNATTVFVSKDLGEKNYQGVNQTLFIIFTLMLFLSTSAAVGLWVGSDSISSYLNVGSNHLTVATSLKVGGLVVWTRMIQQVLVGVEQAHQKYAFVNLLVTLQSLVTNLGMLLIVWWGGKAILLLQWQLIINLLTLLAHVWFVFLLLSKYRQMSTSWNKNKWTEIASYSLITWFGSLGSVSFGQLDKIIVSYALGAKELGVYAFITSMCSQINTFSGMCVQPILPIISNSISSENIDMQSVKKNVKLALQLNTTVSLAMGIGLFASAPLILSFSLKGNPEYRTLFQISALIYGFYSCNTVGYHLLLGIKATQEYMKILLTSGAASLLLIYLGVNQFGLKGAIIGNVGYFTIWLFTLVGMKKLNVNLSEWVRWIIFPFLWALIQLAIISTIMASGNYFLSLLTCFLGFVVIGVWLFRDSWFK